MKLLAITKKGEPANCISSDCNGFGMEKFFYTRKDVMHLTTFSRTKIDDLERKGLFPKRIKSNLRVFWVAEEVNAWRDEVIKNADR